MLSKKGEIGGHCEHILKLPRCLEPAGLIT